MTAKPEILNILANTRVFAAVEKLEKHFHTRPPRFSVLANRRTTYASSAWTRVANKIALTREVTKCECRQTHA